jgi:hypothetical protein
MAATPGIAAQLTLTWTDNADNESGSRIERRNSQVRTPRLRPSARPSSANAAVPRQGLMAFFILSASATRP